MAEKLAECPEFTVTRIKLTDPLHLTTEHFDSFIIWVSKARPPSRSHLQTKQESATIRTPTSTRIRKRLGST